MGSIPRARPFLYLDPPAVTSACLSDARLCSLISARGTGVLGNPLLRLGLPRRFDSLFTRVALSALAEKETGVRPNGLGLAAGWEGSRYVIRLLPPCLFLNHAADGPAPAGELARCRHVALVLVHPALEHGIPPLDQPPHAFVRMPSR